MTQAERLFLSLLRNGMLNIQSNEIHGDLSSVELLAKSHLCLPLVYQGALNCNITPQEEWKKSALRVVLRNENNLRAQSFVLSELESADIPCAVIKGSSAAVNYSLPYIRPLGDIDILIRESDYEKTIALLKSKGLTSEEQNHHFHYGFVKDGFKVEIHKNISAFANDDYGKLCAQIMESALDNVEYASYETFRFPVLTKKYQALCLLFHMQRHFFENKLVIRMLCDWAMFVETVSKTEWDREIKGALKQLNLTKFADALTSLCDQYFGTNNAGKIEEYFEQEFYDCFMDEFLSGGLIADGIHTSKNFGNIYSQKLLKTNNKVLALIFSLNEIARENFKIAKYPCFLPLFWCYLPVRYLFRLLIGKRDKLSFKSAVNSAKHWKELYKKLNFHNS